VHLETLDFWQHPLEQQTVPVCAGVFSKLG